MQVARLRELRPEALSSRLEISTVDGFQGREKEAIVISMVGGAGRVWWEVVEGSSLEGVGESDLVPSLLLPPGQGMVSCC